MSKRKKLSIDMLSLHCNGGAFRRSVLPQIAKYLFVCMI